MITASLQKLQTHLEDIFEESDSFPAEVTDDDVSSSKYYSAISQGDQQPLLSLRAIGKIFDYASRLKGKRRSEGIEWDTDAFSRILRMLEKVMREAEDIDVFAEPRRLEAVPAKKVKGANGKKSSKSPEVFDEQADGGGEVELSEERARSIEGELHEVATAGMAATAVFTLLDLEGLSKQVGCTYISLLTLTRRFTLRTCFPWQSP